MKLTHNLVKYRLIEEHMKAVRSGNYEVARALLHLLRKSKISVGLADIACAVELIAESCGCRIRYSRNYNVAYISF